MKYKLLIGLEVHVQLGLKTKAFCRCKNEFGGIPNSRTCPVCLGLPGALPVTNVELINSAILLGHATNSKINSVVKFDRKHYMYPDLPKGYQISQYDKPICENGFVRILTKNGIKKIHISRIHMEEDSGKSFHLFETENQSYIDFNRAGVPLLEIVSSPDINNGEEAVLYLSSLREIFRYLCLSNCNMENGSMRCDVNINLLVKEDDKEYKTPIVEIKNLNSFKSIKMAVEYEENRQKKEWLESRKILENFGKYTRGFDYKKGITMIQRVKEVEDNYMFIKEPDLPLIRLSDKYIENIKNKMVELPFDARIRLKEKYGLTDFDVVVLTGDKNLLKYFEDAALFSSDPKMVANWILSEVLNIINEKKGTILDFNLPAKYISDLLELVISRKISGKMAKEIFFEMVNKGVSAEFIVKEKGLEQISDENEIEKVVFEVLNENPKSVDLYKKGKIHAIKFMMGQIMKKTSGKVNPLIANNILLNKLKDE